MGDTCCNKKGSGQAFITSFVPRKSCDRTGLKVIGGGTLTISVHLKHLVWCSKCCLLMSCSVSTPHEV